jgi:hypothetical protein
MINYKYMQFFDYLEMLPKPEDLPNFNHVNTCFEYFVQKHHFDQSDEETYEANPTFASFYSGYLFEAIKTWAKNDFYKNQCNEKFEELLPMFNKTDVSLQIALVIQKFATIFMVDKRTAPLFLTLSILISFHLWTDLETPFHVAVPPRMFAYVESLIYLALWEKKADTTYVFKATAGKDHKQTIINHDQFAEIVDYFERSVQWPYEQFIDASTAPEIWWWKFYGAEVSIGNTEGALNKDRKRNFGLIIYLFITS